MEEVMSRTTRSRKRVIGVVALASAALLGLTACGSSSSPQSAAAPAVAATAATSALGADQWISNPGDFKDAANWDIAKKLTIALGGGAINPASLDLVAGLPYEIAISNSDSADLGIGAKDFFRGSAVRKTESGAEIKIYLFKEVFVKAGKSVNLFIIPVVPGTYDLAGIDASGAPVSGMTGKVNVTGSLPTKPAPAIAAISTLGMPADADALVAAAIPTWDATAVKATITMGDTAAAHFYKPKDTVLKVGVPTILTFVNNGNATHVNEMADFFKTTALWKVVGVNGWNTGNQAKPADIEPGVTVILYLIPTQAGSFSLTDSTAGMEKMAATITVK
jgi:hypothetical protein